MDAVQNITSDRSSGTDEVVEAADMSPTQTNATGTSIMDLNEYCLLEMFSCKMLSIWDLCSLAETCRRFKRITRLVPVREFSFTNEVHPVGIYTFKWGKKAKSYCKRDALRIFKNFGFKLGTLTIHRKPDSLCWIARYCRDATLKQIEFYAMNSIQGICQQLKLIFKRALSLSVSSCILRDRALTIDCEALVELKIIDSTGWYGILKSNFPNLERFTFRYRALWHRNDRDVTGQISSFISRHKRLKIINLDSGSVYYNSDLAAAIGNSCEELEELSLIDLKTLETPLDAISRLNMPKLKKVNLQMNNENYKFIIALLREASVSLETVELRFLDQAALESFKSFPLAMFTRLSKLRLGSLQSQIFAADIFNIISQLTDLEEFRVRSWIENYMPFFLGYEEFEQIVEIVEQRTHELKLWCDCNFQVPRNGMKKQNVTVNRYYMRF